MIIGQWMGGRRGRFQGKEIGEQAWAGYKYEAALDTTAPFLKGEPAMTNPQIPDRPTSLEDIRAGRKPLENVNDTHTESLTGMQRLALTITERVGTMGFFLIVFTWTVIWLGWNLIAPKHLQFDPPTAFVFWLFISNLIQIMLMPLIMVGQNLQGQHSELRAQSDYEVNVKSEAMIELLLLHLERQEAMLERLYEKVMAETA